MKLKTKIGILTISIFSIFSSINVLGATVYYEKNENETITNGVYYENTIRATDVGIQNIHVMTVDISNEYISVGPAINEVDYGLRDNVVNLLNGSNAIAGVNGDFFGTASNYATSFGPVFIDGEMISLTTGINKEENNFASFYIEEDNNPFILYLRPEIDFLNDGKENMEVYSINKVTDMVFPVLINRNAMNDTSSIDARIPNTYKIVVEDGYITHISQRGGYVQVPENGYVIVVSDSAFDYFGQFYEVGQSAEIIIRGGINYDNIQSSIGGGGRLLLDGTVVNDTGTVVRGRHPRTAVGISEDKSQIILVAVDGRGDSVGATHTEMAYLLSEFGAYNGMHLDGGGSTTMAISTLENQDLHVVNEPSDGSLRNVINALGVYNNAPSDLPLSSIKINVTDGFVNAPVVVNILGLNDGYKEVPINIDEITFSASENGTWDGNVFYPAVAGNIEITAQLNENIYTSESINVKPLAELRANVNNIFISEGETFQLHFQGISDMGDSVNINSNITYEIVPDFLGVMDNNTFIFNEGNGYIKASYNNVDTYIGVYSSTVSKSLYDFNNITDISFSTYNSGDAEIFGDVSYSTDTKGTEDMELKLSYEFPIIEGTQASYLNFDTPLEISENVSKLSLDVFGDNSNNWLRGKVLDSNNKLHTIDFSKTIDWYGYKEVTSILPKNIKYPIKLTTLYVVTTNANELNYKGTLYFDNLVGHIPYTPEELVIPEGPKFVDPLLQNLDNYISDNSYDVTVIGDWYLGDSLKTEEYDLIRTNEMLKIRENSSQIFYAGETDYTTDIGVPVYQWFNGYEYFNSNDFDVFQLEGTRKGLSKVDATQWLQFSENIKYSTKNYALVLIDKNPLNFSNDLELELFHSILEDSYNSGKTVFVISTEGNETTNTIIDGVRYINLGSLFNENGYKNDGFGTLRFRIDENGITYDINN